MLLSLPSWLLLLFATGEGEFLIGATLATGVGETGVGELAGVVPGKTVVVVPGAGRVTPVAGVGGTWTVLAVQRTCREELDIARQNVLLKE